MAEIQYDLGGNVIIPQGTVDESQYYQPPQVDYSYQPPPVTGGGAGITAMPGSAAWRAQQEYKRAQEAQAAIQKATANQNTTTGGWPSWLQGGSSDLWNKNVTSGTVNEDGSYAGDVSLNPFNFATQGTATDLAKQFGANVVKSNYAGGPVTRSGGDEYGLDFGRGDVLNAGRVAQLYGPNSSLAVRDTDWAAKDPRYGPNFQDALVRQSLEAELNNAGLYGSGPIDSRSSLIGQGPGTMFSNADFGQNRQGAAAVGNLSPNRSPGVGGGPGTEKYLGGLYNQNSWANPGGAGSYGTVGAAAQNPGRVVPPWMQTGNQQYQGGNQYQGLDNSTMNQQWGNNPLNQNTTGGMSGFAQFLNMLGLGGLGQQGAFGAQNPGARGGFQRRPYLPGRGGNMGMGARYSNQMYYPAFGM